MLIAARIEAFIRTVTEKYVLNPRAAATICSAWNAESARTTTIPVASAERAVLIASATKLPALCAEFVAPRRSLAATITGRGSGVDTTAISAFSPLTFEYPIPTPCLA
nr:hypothetical protein [Nocardia miyunensis]